MKAEAYLLGCIQDTSSVSELKPRRRKGIGSRCRSPSHQEVSTAPAEGARTCIPDACRKANQTSLEKTQATRADGLSACVVSGSSPQSAQESLSWSSCLLRLSQVQRLPCSANKNSSRRKSYEECVLRITNDRKLQQTTQSTLLIVR